MAISNPVEVGTGAYSSGSVIAATLTANVPAGATLFLASCQQAAGASQNPITSVADAASNPWAVAATIGQNTGPEVTDLWYGRMTTGLSSGSTVTATYSAAPSIGVISLFYVTGCDASAPLDVHAAAATSSSAPNSGTTGTLASASEIAIGVIGRYNAATTITLTGIGSYTALTKRDNGSGTNRSTIWPAYLLTSATTGQAYSGTLSSPGRWEAVVATFKASAGTLLTQPGVSRIQATRTSTQPGRTRIQRTLTSTQAGVSRILGTRTQPGVSRIRATRTRTQAGVANISAGGVRTNAQAGAAHINTAMATLVDSFNTGAYNTALWSDNGQVSVVSNQLVITCPASSAADHALSSLLRYDLRNSQFAIQLVSAGNQSLTSMEIYLQLQNAAFTNKLFFYISQNGIGIYDTVAGTQTQRSFLSYVAGTHNWFRIRESGGTVFWEWSTNGIAWNTAFSEADPFTPNDLQALIQSGTWQAEASATSSIYDNVNVPAAALTQTGRSRLQATPTSTQSGRSRVLGTSAQTGRSRIRSTPTSAQAGRAHIHTPMATLVDTFNTGAYNPALWTDNGQVSVASNQLVITCPASTAAYHDLFSIYRYDLRNSQIVVQLVSAGNQALTSMEAYPILLQDATAANKLFVVISQNGIGFYKTVATIQTQVAFLAYTAGTHNWFRIREAAGTVFWEWSTDALTWNSVHSEADPFTPNDLQAILQAGTYAAEASGSSGVFDNVNSSATTSGQPGRSRIQASRQSTQAGRANIATGGAGRTRTQAGVSNIASPLKAIIPLYVYPISGAATPDWNTVITNPPFAVIANPASGPGTALDTNYQAAIAAVRAAGVKVLGYVNVGYNGSTTRPLGTTSDTATSNTIYGDINGWTTIYGSSGIDGYFFDLTPTDAGAHLTLTQNAASYCRSHLSGSFVMCNPGTYPLVSDYIDLADTVCVWESTSESYDDFAIPSYTSSWTTQVQSYARPRQAHLVYQTPDEPMARLEMCTAVRANAGYFYAANDQLGIWSSLASYWPAERADLIAGNFDCRAWEFQAGQSRIRATPSQTQAGVARVAGPTQFTRAQPGQARIRRPGLSTTQSGRSRITFQRAATQAGLATITTFGKLAPQPGQARIRRPGLTRTQAGHALVLQPGGRILQQPGQSTVLRPPAAPTTHPTCGASVQLCAMRVCTLDSHGAPIGPSVTIDAVGQLQLTPVYIKGTAIDIVPPSGQGGIYQPIPDVFKRYDCTLTLLNVDPEAEAILTGTLSFSSGGFAVGGSGLAVAQIGAWWGVSVEVWTKHVIRTGDLDPQFPYVHWVVPRSYWQPTDMAWDGNAMSRAYEGFTDENPGWTAGPGRDWFFDSTHSLAYCFTASIPAPRCGS